MVNKHLGRGFDSLLNNTSQQSRQSKKLIMTVEVPIARVTPNPWQPRRVFNEDSILELAESIQNNGVISPIIVRRQGDQYVLIAGERRLRAAGIAGLQRIPAIIKDVTDQEMIEISLIENIQREDLNPLDKAQAYKDLMQRFSYTQEQVAERLGQKRPSIANLIRLLNLPEKVQSALRNGSISMGHARAILAVDNEVIQENICEMVVRENLSVREVEKLASHEPTSIEDQPDPNFIEKPKASKEVDPQITEVEEYLRKFFGTRVLIKHKKSKGQIMIDYYDIADLNRILSLLDEKE